MKLRFDSLLELLKRVPNKKVDLIYVVGAMGVAAIFACELSYDNAQDITMCLDRSASMIGKLGVLFL